MKLVEILARELKEWPPECEYFFADLDNEVRGSPETVWDFYPKNEVDIEDRRVRFRDEHHIITRAQWEAERARILAESSKFTEQDKEHIAEENREAEDFAFEKWCSDNEYDCRKRLDGSGYINPSTARAFLAWKASRNTNVWQRAVDEQLVSSHLGVAGDVSQIKAHALLGELIDWHVGVATDPKVNGGFYLSKSPAYEQELWDRVAARRFNSHMELRIGREYASREAFDDADAFMAERAKRLKR